MTPVALSAWNDLVTSDCEGLVGMLDQFLVMGVIAVKASSYRNVSSLSTTTSSYVVVDPPGDKAKAIRDWVAANIASLTPLKQPAKDNPYEGQATELKPISYVNGRQCLAKATGFLVRRSCWRRTLEYTLVVTGAGISLWRNQIRSSAALASLIARDLC